MKTKILVTYFLLLFGLVTAGGAQEKTPLIGASDYALILTPYVSRQVAESVQLGYLMDYYTSDGCVLTSASDGAMVCLLYHSCSLDQPIVCALTFNARVGLRLEDVAFLSVLPSTDPVPFLNSDGNRILDLLNLQLEPLYR